MRRSWCLSPVEFRCAHDATSFSPFRRDPAEKSRKNHPERSISGREVENLHIGWLANLHKICQRSAMPCTGAGMLADRQIHGILTDLSARARCHRTACQMSLVSSCPTSSLVFLLDHIFVQVCAKKRITSIGQAVLEMERLNMCTQTMTPVCWDPRYAGFSPWLSPVDSSFLLLHHRTHPPSPTRSCSGAALARLTCRAGETFVVVSLRP